MYIRNSRFDKNILCFVVDGDIVPKRIAKQLEQSGRASHYSVMTFHTRSWWWTLESARTSTSRSLWRHTRSDMF